MSMVVTIYCPNCGEPLQVAVEVASIGGLRRHMSGLQFGSEGQLDVTFKEASVEHKCPSRIADRVPGIPHRDV